MLLFATIMLQVDVGCIDCSDSLEGLSSNALIYANSTSADSQGEELPEAVQRLKERAAATKSWQASSGFPKWLSMTAFGVLALAGILLAGKGLLRKIFIVSKQRKKHGRAKTASRKADYRDDWKPKRAHRKGFAKLH